MFIGRERELAMLERMFNSDKFEFAVVYGRRRIGKTALLSHFAQDKRAIFFTGIEQDARKNLQIFTSEILKVLSGTSGDARFADFYAALDFVFRNAGDQRLILIIDEYPYVARACKSLASVLQQLIDRYQDGSKLMLILCGSSVSYMEDEVLAYNSPLYGRRTAQLKILPFDFKDARRFWKHASAENQALFYGMVGGTPQYIRALSDTLSLKDNLKNTFLNALSALYTEPGSLISQELREPALYNTVISAIAAGASKLSEISTKTGISSGVCAKYINTLINLEIVKKETPYGEKTSKKTLYSIADSLFRFWYRFIPENTTAIERGVTDGALKEISSELSDYMGPVFEEICRQYLWDQLSKGKCPVKFVSLGRWWGNDPLRKEQAEIDIMGEQDRDTALFAECKWRNEKADLNTLETLIARSRLFSYANVSLYLFSKSGFTKGCVERAGKSPEIHLVSYAQILKDFQLTDN